MAIVPALQAGGDSRFYYARGGTPGCCLPGFQPDGMLREAFNALCKFRMTNIMFIQPALKVCTSAHVVFIKLFGIKDVHEGHV